MMPNPNLAPPSELPEPSAVLVLFRVFLCAFLTVSGPKKGEAVLREMAEMLATEESLSSIMPIRPASQAHGVTKARREAVAAFRALLPAFLGMVRK